MSLLVLRALCDVSILTPIATNNEALLYTRLRKRLQIDGKHKLMSSCLLNSIHSIHSFIHTLDTPFTIRDDTSNVQ